MELIHEEKRSQSGIEESKQLSEEKCTNLNDVIGYIRRRRPCDDGLYINIKIQGVKMLFTADTGATKTVISDRVYKKIPEELRPKLKPTTKLTGACGTPMVELGKATFDIELEDFKVRHEVTVAEIVDEGLLGMDILQNTVDWLADILLSKGIIKFKNAEILCMQVRNSDKT